MLAYQFPVAHAECYLSAVFRKLPVQKIMLLLIALAQKGRQKADAVGVFGLFEPCQVRQGRHNVVLSRYQVGFAAGLDVSRPTGDHGYPDPTFVHEAFSLATFLAEGARAVKESAVRTARKSHAIVGGENNKGVVIKAFIL